MPDHDHPDPALTARFAALRARAADLRRSTAAERRAKLRKLEAAFLARRSDLAEALRRDLGKAAAETELTDLVPVLLELRHAVRHLGRWMRPRRVAPPLPLLGTSAAQRPEPRGACLILSPWNFPVNLALGPLISAVAAGNTVLLKPSELSPASSAFLAALVGEVFDPAEVTVIEGDAAVATRLLELPFDHVFFTGSPAVGQVVMTAAARHLSSVTLELGGKSPAIVDASADVRQAARSLVWGKFLNCGQTCVAPDHVYVEATILAPFVAAAKQALADYFGTDPAASPAYGRIVTGRHWDRLTALLEGALRGGARVEAGGRSDAATRYLEPTLLTLDREDLPLMSEEIFGPLLPLLPYRDLGQVLDRVNARPKPLALYLYTRRPEAERRVLTGTASGGLVINANVVQFTHTGLAFGGINTSGIGASHGKAGFLAFSHERALLRDHLQLTRLLRPPYTSGVLVLIGLLRRFLAR